MKYLVVKMDDLLHLDGKEIDQLEGLVNKINEGRRSEGKKDNSYVVVNRDESYVNEIVEIMENNGHWG